MDLEASRKPSGFEDIFIGYHAKDDVQTTYAGSLFRNNRNFHISTQKRNVSLSEFHYQIQRLWHLIILFRCDWDFLHVYHYYFNQGAVFVCYLIAYYVFSSFCVFYLGSNLHLWIIQLIWLIVSIICQLLSNLGKFIPTVISKSCKGLTDLISLFSSFLRTLLSIGHLQGAFPKGTVLPSGSSPLFLAIPLASAWTMSEVLTWH